MKLTTICLIAIVAFACLVSVASADKNTKEGAAFLKKNAEAPGVHVLPSGLQYKILQQASGAGGHPSRSDTVRVHYRGTTIDGKEFDSSYSRGQPAEFGVTQVIAGWTEILQIMAVGDIYEVTIPSELAYGARGAGGLIGPNAVLQFKIELLGIQGKDL